MSIVNCESIMIYCNYAVFSDSASRQASIEDPKTGLLEYKVEPIKSSDLKQASVSRFHIVLNQKDNTLSSARCTITLVASNSINDITYNNINFIIVIQHADTQQYYIYHFLQCERIQRITPTGILFEIKNPMKINKTTSIDKSEALELIEKLLVLPPEIIDLPVEFDTIYHKDSTIQSIYETSNLTYQASSNSSKVSQGSLGTLMIDTLPTNASGCCPNCCAVWCRCQCMIL